MDTCHDRNEIVASMTDSVHAVLGRNLRRQRQREAVHTHTEKYCSWSEKVPRGPLANHKQAPKLVSRSATEGGLGS